MQVTKDKFEGFDVFRVDGAPVAGRSSDEHDDHWYVHVNGLGVYAFVPTHDEYGDHSPYEEIVVDESHDFAERWDRILKNPLRLAEIVKHDVDATLIDRMLDAGTMKLYFHGVDGNGDGFLPDTIGSDGHVGASVFQEARRTAKEAVGAGSGDEDWSGWRIEVTTEPNGKGVNVAQFGFEELGAWSPKPEVEFDPSETYTGVGDDLHKAFWNALEKAQEDGLTFEAVEGLSMDVSIDTDADGELYTRVDIEFCPNDSMTVMFWKPDDSLREVVDGEDIGQVIDAYDEDWIEYSEAAIHLLAEEWSGNYRKGRANMEDLVGILNGGDVNFWKVTEALDMGGDSEDVIMEAYERFVCAGGGEGREIVMVTSKGDGIVYDFNGNGLSSTTWREVEKAITDRLAKTDDEDEIAELNGMLAAVSEDNFLTLSKLIEDGEFDGLERTFANAEAAFANAEVTLDRVKEQLAEFKWLNKAKSLPGIIETTMTRDLGENMAPFAKAMGEIAGLACRQFPNDDEAVISYLADGLVNKVGFDRNVAVAVLEGVVKVGDFDADPAAIMATIPTKDEIAAMERKAVETSGIGR